MRIVVLGAGAMGCLFGGLLHEAGNEVTLVDVDPVQIDAVNNDGLLLERDGEARRVRVAAARAADVTVAPDLVVLFTKTLHSRAALESARGFVGERTVVLSLQNGLGNEEIMGLFVPPARIVQGVTTFPADLVAPGHVRSLGHGHTQIMNLDGTVTPRLDEICRCLDGAGLRCVISPEVGTAIWEKVAFNAALNTLTAVTRSPVGAIADSPEATDLAQRVAAEVVEVAQRKGIGARKDVVLATMAGALAGHREHLPSMLQDMMAGRPTEVDSLNGAVVREAKAMGLQVPFTEALYLLVRMLEAGASGVAGGASGGCRPARGLLTSGTPPATLRPDVEHEQTSDDSGRTDGRRRG